MWDWCPIATLPTLMISLLLSRSGMMTSCDCLLLILPLYYIYRRLSRVNFNLFWNFRWPLTLADRWPLAISLWLNRLVWPGQRTRGLTAPHSVIRQMQLLREAVWSERVPVGSGFLFPFNCSLGYNPPRHALESSQTSHASIILYISAFASIILNNSKSSCKSIHTMHLCRYRAAPELAGSLLYLRTGVV